MTRFRSVFVGLIVVGVLLALVPSSGAQPAGQGGGPARVYKIRLVNDHDMQPMSPPVWVVHSRDFDLVEEGEPASYGVKEVAENADGEPLNFALNLGVDGVLSAGIASGGGASGTGPVTPGTGRTWQVTTRDGSRLFSMVAMIGCTNDGLVMADSLRLPRRVGGKRTFPLFAFDAGTEINDEELDHMMPPCSAGVTGSFVSDPTLAENGVIAFHPGIVGGGDLDPADWGWDDPIARLIVVRMR